VCRIDPDESGGLAPCTTEKAGQPCTTPGAECDAGFGCNARLRCTDRNPRFPSCPISARAAKREIAYVTPEEARRLYDELTQLRLATYRYRNESPDAERRLGFIIDDTAMSPAVAPDRSMVDLYGFTSMAVAAIQEQRREIDHLKQQMRALRRTCGAPGTR
jgi:hypothetical protein